MEVSRHKWGGGLGTWVLYLMLPLKKHLPGGKKIKVTGQTEMSMGFCWGDLGQLA